MNSAAQKILNYFNKIDVITRKDGNYCKKTGVGEFIPSSLEHLYLGFNYLITKGIMNKSSIFCDAGCGDGRVILLISGAYKIPSFGIEYDTKVASRARSHLIRLQRVIKGTPADIAVGDFTNDEVYNSKGIQFEAVGTFFNYVNSPRGIAKKIVKQSPKGTLFILYDGRPKPEIFRGLKLKLSFELIDNSNEVIVRYPLSSDKPLTPHPLPDRAFMHLYRK